jgi:hypothetical protein
MVKGVTAGDHHEEHRVIKATKDGLQVARTNQIVDGGGGKHANQPETVYRHRNKLFDGCPGRNAIQQPSDRGGSGRQPDEMDDAIGGTLRSGVARKVGASLRDALGINRSLIYSVGIQAIGPSQKTLPSASRTTPWPPLPRLRQGLTARPSLLAPVGSTGTPARCCVPADLPTRLSTAGCFAMWWDRAPARGAVRMLIRSWPCCSSPGGERLAPRLHLEGWFRLECAHYLMP